MQYMGVPPQNNMGLPQQQAAVAQGMAAGMMQQGMQPQPMQHLQHQGMPPGALHGDMMMQQHTHMTDHMGSALSLDAFPTYDLLDDAFDHFASPATDTPSSSSQHEAEPGVSQGASVKTETQAQLTSSSAAAPNQNPSLQRNLRKLSVKGRAKPTEQARQSTPEDMFTSAMQHAQMQMSMAMPVVGPGSWLSPSTLDTSQDGVRRPPAA